MASIPKYLAALAMVLLPAAGPAMGAEADFLTALAQGHSRRIVVYGTSLTANSAWPAGLESTLRGEYGWKLSVVNAARGGKDSRWGIANLDSRVIRQRPDTVFIEFAINDALASSRLGVSESMENLDRMIARIRGALPDCDVIVMVMNPPTGEALEKRPAIREYEAGYRRVAARNSCRLISFSARWREIITHDPASWQSHVPDGLHPDAWAAREVILPYLLKKLGHPPRPQTSGGGA
jgi:lysophospholipase L1-like esterase